MSKWSKWFERRLNGRSAEHYLCETYNDRKQWIKLMLSLTPNAKTYHEVGAGSGYNTRVASIMKPEREYIASDLELEVVRFMNIHHVIKSKIVTCQADMFKIDFNSDVIWSDGVLEHFDKPDIIKALKHMKEHSDIQCHAVPTAYAQKHTTETYGNERWYTPSEWIDMAQNAGYTNVKAYAIDHGFLPLVMWRKLFPDLTNQLPMEANAATTILLVMQ